jgi:ferredoxin
VKIISGAENLSAPSPRENDMMREKQFAADERAACQAKVFGDVCISAEYW